MKTDISNYQTCYKVSISGAQIQVQWANYFELVKDWEMARIGNVVGIFFALGLLGGCATDVANRYYVTEKFSAVAPERVEILTSAPKGEFVVIADFQSRGESPEDLRVKAAAIGADAVIVSLFGGYASVNEEWAGKDRYSKTYNRIAGTAIKFKKGK